MDVWSRRIVGWRVAEGESADIAAELVMQACRDSQLDPRGLVLHSDNGAPMRASTMIATLQWLGVVPSFSRPHVSDDNPYSEALFRTLKHTPAYPRLPFAGIASAQQWVGRFVGWYNGEHRHSARCASLVSRACHREASRSLLGWVYRNTVATGDERVWQRCDGLRKRCEPPTLWYRTATSGHFVGSKGLPPSRPAAQ